MNILDQIDSDIKLVNNIEKQLFQVKTIQLHTGLEGFESPESYGVYKTTGGRPLGVVGNVFNPTQPIDIFNIFKDGLLENGLPLDGMKYNEFKGGSKIKFMLPIGKVQFTNIRKETDESIVNLNFQTGFDGKTKTTIYLSILRLVCTNGMKAQTREFELSVKNTSGNTGKIQTAANEIGKAVGQISELQQLITHLNERPINQEMIDQFLLETTGMNQKTVKEKSSRSQAIFDKINESVALELNRTGNSLWGLVNGITHFTNHVQTLDRNGNAKLDTNENIFLGSGLSMNNKAQQVALALAN